MPPEYGGRRIRQPEAAPRRNGNVPAVFARANRHHPTERDCRTWRNGDGGFARRDATDGATSWALAWLSKYPTHGHISSGIPAAQPGARGKTEGLGRHVACPGTAWSQDFG